MPALTTEARRLAKVSPVSDDRAPVLLRRSEHRCRYRSLLHADGPPRDPGPPIASRAHSFLSFRFRHGLLSVAIPASSLEIGPVRPGDDRVEKSLQRGQRSIYATVLATMPAIASTGAMLGCGQKAPVSRGP